MGGGEARVQGAIAAAVPMRAPADHIQHPCWCYGQQSATLNAAGAGCSVAGGSDVRSNIHHSAGHHRTGSGSGLDARP